MKKVLLIIFLGLIGGAVLMIGALKVYSYLHGLAISEPLPNEQVEEPILENVVYRTFSSTSTQDKFSILINGTTILDGTMRFTISNSEGLTLHSEEYPSYYLIGYGLNSTTATTKEKEEYIKNRVNDFFEDSNFSIPAIAEDDELDPDYSNKENWANIKLDRTAIGFYYLIGEEGGCRIAYSKKQNRTIKYFCCC